MFNLKILFKSMTLNGKNFYDVTFSNWCISHFHIFQIYKNVSTLTIVVQQWNCIPFLYFVDNKAKGRISKRVLQENKTEQISLKLTFLTPWYAHACFLVTPVLKFALLPYYRPFMVIESLLVKLHEFFMGYLSVPNITAQAILF